MPSLFSKLADNPGTGPYYAPGSTGYESPASQGWGGGSGMSFAGFVGQMIGVIDALIPLFIIIALIIFFVGLIQYIYKSDDAHGHGQSKELILWGLVALFVLMSLWGILDLAKTSLFPS